MESDNLGNRRDRVVPEKSFGALLSEDSFDVNRTDAAFSCSLLNDRRGLTDGPDAARLNFWDKSRDWSGHGSDEPGRHADLGSDAPADQHRPGTQPAALGRRDQPRTPCSRQSTGPLNDHQPDQGAGGPATGDW